LLLLLKLSADGGSVSAGETTAMMILILITITIGSFSSIAILSTVVEGNFCW